MITVAFTVSCVRQRYLRDALESWAKARGEARFVFCLEPPGTFPVQAFTEYLDRTFPARTLVFENTRRLGCLGNTRLAMRMALQVSDDGFAAVAEEDLEVADDVLEYLTWARDAYRGDGQVQAVCAHAKDSVLADEAGVVRAPWFRPLVWGTWQDRWSGWIDGSWGPLPESNNPESWDTNLMHQIKSRGYCSVFPVRSRVIHRGEISTLHQPDLSAAFAPGAESSCYQPHYEPQQYREIGFPPAPGDLVVLWRP